MIAVNYRLYPDVKESEFRIRGHALTAPKGEDIVCAAVSALGINTVNSLDKLLNLALEVEMEDGHLYCRILEVPQSSKAQAFILLQSLILGLKAIATEYPKSIRVSGTEY